MGQAGIVLQQVLHTYQIPESQLAKELGVTTAAVANWTGEIRDPYSEQVRAIVKVLRRINPQSADTFKTLYWDSL
ncbi:MAG: XRE family transcriptional regulator [Prochlorotrichaceae cyanobacterium]|jgi:predicted transcriptional regulator